MEIHNKNNHIKTAHVDIDETICFFDGDRVYENAIPNYNNIAKINDLFDSGWNIVYSTARGSSQRENKERLEYLRELTLSQLHKWGAKFHYLEIGDVKSLYDLIVDDKAKRIEEL